MFGGVAFTLTIFSQPAPIPAPNTDRFDSRPSDSVSSETETAAVPTPTAAQSWKEET